MARRRATGSMAEVGGDAQLLERFLRQGDESAFERLMRCHGPMVFAVCRRVLRHTQDAEDACQIAFLVLARKAGGIGRGESIPSWLYTVAYRIALRLKRRTARYQKQAPLADVLDNEPGSAPPDQAVAHELSRWLDTELRQIPEKYRTAFRLCHLEGKTSDEAATHLGCPRGTIQSRIGRARQRLRARLALPQP